MEFKFKDRNENENERTTVYNLNENSNLNETDVSKVAIYFLKIFSPKLLEHIDQLLSDGTRSKEHCTQNISTNGAHLHY